MQDIDLLSRIFFDKLFIDIIADDIGTFRWFSEARSLARVTTCFIAH